jgi:hypothetical protein
VGASRQDLLATVRADDDLEKTFGSLGLHDVCKPIIVLCSNDVLEVWYKYTW